MSNVNGRRTALYDKDALQPSSDDLKLDSEKYTSVFSKEEISYDKGNVYLDIVSE